jgi:hypothetical protein
MTETTLFDLPNHLENNQPTQNGIPHTLPANTEPPTFVQFLASSTRNVVAAEGEFFRNGGNRSAA